MTTRDAAARLGISTGRVRQLILAGKLPAQKHGRDWLIRPEDLVLLDGRRPGWPRGKPRNVARRLDALPGGKDENHEE